MIIPHSRSKCSPSLLTVTISPATRIAIMDSDSYLLTLNVIALFCFFQPLWGHSKITITFTSCAPSSYETRCGLKGFKRFNQELVGEDSLLSKARPCVRAQKIAQYAHHCMQIAALAQLACNCLCNHRVRVNLRTRLTCHQQHPSYIPILYIYIYIS